MATTTEKQVIVKTPNKPQSDAERQRKRRQRKAEKGLVKVEVWVPVGSAHIVKDLEAQLNANG